MDEKFIEIKPVCLRHPDRAENAGIAIVTSSLPGARQACLAHQADRYFQRRYR